MKNYVEQFMEDNNIELDERFSIEGRNFNYWFDKTENGEIFLYGSYKNRVFTAEYMDLTMVKLLNGNLKIVKRPFKPKNESCYWKVDMYGEIKKCDFYKYNEYHLAMVMIGNCFKTESEAKKNRERIIKLYNNYKNIEISLSEIK